jgi:hypothetical protein
VPRLLAGDDRSSLDALAIPDLPSAFAVLSRAIGLLRCKACRSEGNSRGGTRIAWTYRAARLGQL